MTLCAWLGTLLIVLSSAIRLENPDKTWPSRDLGSALASGRLEEDMWPFWPFAEATKTPQAKDKYCRVGEIFRSIATHASPAKLGRCALVGSSADLQGKAHGQEIDDHDTVIRVNRIPTSDYIVDFGARTDILFTAPQYFKTSGLYYFDFGGKMRHCSYYDDDCPINTFVLKGVDVKEWGHHSFAHLFPQSSPGWLPPFSKFAVSRQDERFDALASHLLNYTGEPGTRPTTGFQAVLTFAVACKTLRIYGFSGTTNADDHEVTSFHNLTMEHLVVRKFVSGNLTQDIAQFFPEYGRCLEHKLQSRR